LTWICWKWHWFQETWKKHLFSFIFKIYIVCLLGCFPYFLKFSLFVCLLSSFLPFFLPPVKRTINLGGFFSNFQGFTLVPWQKVGRIGLGFAQNEPIIYQILFFPLPVFERYDTKAKISYFSSLITIIFHSGSSKRNFWCKEHSCSSKIVKVSNFPPVLTGFLLSFFPCIRTIWHRIQETWKKHLFSCLYLLKFPKLSWSFFQQEKKWKRTKQLLTKAHTSKASPVN